VSSLVVPSAYPSSLQSYLRS